MFVQIIEGRTSQPDAMRKLGQRWQEELRPGAEGYLGSTGGVTADGKAINIVRFASPDAARKNSDRPEQTAFFHEMSLLYDGAPTFTESTDVEEFFDRDPNSAGFVQVMKTDGLDRVRMREVDAAFAQFKDQRPDLLGFFRVWTDENTAVEVAYFTDEAEARANESKEFPEDMQKLMADFADLMQRTEYLDLREPLIY